VGSNFTLTLPSPLPSPERLAFAEALAQAGYAQAGIKGEVILFIE
jgi:hypothetical protein